MHLATIPNVPAPPADAIVPESDAPAPRPWCPNGPQAEVVALGDRIAELSARIQAATWELLSLIRQFDERYGWAGCTSCAEWLGWRTGLAPGAAREHVRVARAPRRPAEAERRDAARQGLLLEDARGHAGGDARDRGRPAERGDVGHRRPREEDRAGRGGGWTARRSRRRTGGGTRRGRCGRGWTRTGWW